MVHRGSVQRHAQPRLDPKGLVAARRRPGVVGGTRSVIRTECSGITRYAGRPLGASCSNRLKRATRRNQLSLTSDADVHGSPRSGALELKCLAPRRLVASTGMRGKNPRQRSPTSPELVEIVETCCGGEFARSLHRSPPKLGLSATAHSSAPGPRPAAERERPGVHAHGRAERHHVGPVRPDPRPRRATASTRARDRQRGLCHAVFLVCLCFVPFFPSSSFWGSLRRISSSSVPPLRPRCKRRRFRPRAGQQERFDSEDSALRMSPRILLRRTHLSRTGRCEWGAVGS